MFTGLGVEARARKSVGGKLIDSTVDGTEKDQLYNEATIRKKIKRMC